MSLPASKAADDLAHIVDYIRKDDPAAARRVAQTIYQGIAALRKFPNIGRIVWRRTPANWYFPPGLISRFTKSSTITCRCFVSATPHRIGRNG